MKIKSFKIKIEDGKPKVKSSQHRRMIQKWMSQWEGEEVFLSIEDIKEKRSDQQNAYYWAYLTIISEETGHTKDEIHEWARSKFLTEEIVKVFDQPTRRRTSTSSLTKGEFTEYIMNIEKETGIPSPDTQEFWGTSYHK